MTLLLLAGAIGAGKTSAAKSAARQSGVPLLRLRDALAAATGADSSDRLSMQKRAATIDEQTDGEWLVDYLASRPDPSSGAIVDALRTKRQAYAVRRSLQGTKLIFLDASEAVRRERFEAGRATDRMKASTPFDLAMRHPTEIEVLSLRELADTIIETDGLDVQRVASLLAEHLRK